MDLKEELKDVVLGGVATDDVSLAKFSTDASIFEIKPKAVVFPNSLDEVKNIVRWVSSNPGYSVTARSGGTDMTGGPLSSSIVVSMPEHFSKVLEVGED